MNPSPIFFLLCCFCYFLRSSSSFDSLTLNPVTQQQIFPSWVKPADRMLLQASGVRADVVVAADGTGHYTKVRDAVLAAPSDSQKRYIIHIKKGVYTEQIFVNHSQINIMIIGDGMDATIISGELSVRKYNLSTYKTYTFGVDGPGFIARNISFRNTAGPENGQAVAVLSNSDTSVFYQCGIIGYQDSLCANSQRQFYKKCKISGSVDFIFGYAAAVFQDCDILVRKGLQGQGNIITAQGGASQPNQPFGFVFQFCNILADSDLFPFVTSIQTFLGRPWHPYSRVVFMQSNISDVLSPEGWTKWNGTDVYLDTLYYAEYKSYGPGARLENRVKWSGFHTLKGSIEASKFTVSQLISGDMWLPSTGIPFIPGLGN